MAAKASKHNAKGFYGPLGWGVLRTPLLPVEAYSALNDKSLSAATRWRSDGNTLLPADPWVRLALAVGGGHLVETLGDEDKKDAEAPGKLLRYQIRMSTRPTPYGIFAGVALGKFAETTDVQIDTLTSTRRARPDMEWLFSLAGELEARPEVRRQLRVVMHPATFAGSGRVFLADPTPLKDAAHLPVVSVRQSRAVSAALVHAKDYVPYKLLAENLCRKLEADPEKVDKLLTQLWQQGLLLTDLRPPLTDTHPADYVARRLLSLPDPPLEAGLLKSAIAALNQWDALDPYTAATAWPALEKTLRDIHPLATTPIQVDLSLSARQALVNAEVANEAARLADILLRMTPAPPGSGHLGAYRMAFEAKYGHDREIPLLELLDPNLGLGPPAGGYGSGINSQRMAARSEVLQTIALSALAEHRVEVELDDATLKRLSTWEPEPGSLPLSLDLSVFVIADSAAAVDAGRFQIALGPNLGASQAGRYLGRFADVLGQPAKDALAEIARREAEHVPDATWAELAYMPRHLRSGNVVVRSVVRDHEIDVGVGAGVGEDRVIPLGELSVGIHNGRFRLRWRRNGNVVMVRAGHMLTNFQAPQICRFLSDVMEDGLGQISMFDWGPASSYPFLPRIVSGRAILSPARWRITQALRDKELAASRDGFTERLVRFRKSWNMPRHVYVAIGDNRLLLDLDAPGQAEELRTELAGIRESGAMVLHEALPAPEHAWVREAADGSNECGDGHYLSELVVPLVLRPFNRKEPALQQTAIESEEPGPPPTPVSAANRLRPPGSDWLFAKLYCPAVLEEEFLTGPVRDFCHDVSRKGLASGWFFVRYNDPDPHIRLRFRGDPNRLIAQLLPEVCSWGGDMIAEGVCQRVAFDTYDREIERYGGAAGMSAVEALFTADSPAAVDLLAVLRKNADLDRLTLAVASVDDLLKSMGLDVNQRRAWYKARVRSPHSSGADFRERKTTLRALFGSADGFAKLGGTAEIVQIFAERQRSLAPIAKRLDALESRGELNQKRDVILQSVIHMHCNRLAGADRSIEERALGLLLRVHQSLAKAPLASNAPEPVMEGPET
ncbi:MAG: lantibiotic dehydratase [Betaproteobacteria bacterium]|nr:lantibiotic dehydratase [Betaproteobacteria bacterium]